MHSIRFICERYLAED